MNRPVPKSAAIEAAFLKACHDELAAPKPGNVHRHADGHRMTVADFERSAAVAAPLLCRPGAALGPRIRDAAWATREAVGQNTNLGILLLCAPLAMAAERADDDLEAEVARVIAAADVADAQAVFEAIRTAAPAGLGHAARHDVAAPAAVTLQDAMTDARDRDSIAAQYASGFADIFHRGVPAFEDARRRWADPSWAVLATYLHFLADMPDSHIVRNHGTAIAAEVEKRANHVINQFYRAADPTDMLPELLEWDAILKAAHINPGTSADLTVAVCCVIRLRHDLPSRADDGCLRPRSDRSVR